MIIKVVPLSQYEPVYENELCSLCLEGTCGRFDSDTAESDTFLFLVADVSNLAQEVLTFLEHPHTRQTTFEPIEADFTVSFLRRENGIHVSVKGLLLEVCSAASLCHDLLRCLMEVEESLVRKIAVTRNREDLEGFAELLEQAHGMDTRFKTAS